MKLTKENIEKICSENQNKLNGSIIKVSNDECYLILTAWYEGTVEYVNSGFHHDGFNIIKTVHLRGHQLFDGNKFIETHININNIISSTLMYKDFGSIVRYFDGNISKCEYLTPEETDIDSDFVRWLQGAVIKGMYVELKNNNDII